ncbi:MAG: hypothetical protein WCW31_05065 [Patescibacteria group bacterium]
MAKNQNQNQNQGDNNQRKPRSFMGSELVEVLADTGAFLSAQVVLGSIRRGLASVFTNGISSKIDVTKNADSDMISAAIKQVKDNIKALDLPADLKHEADQSITRVLLESVTALGNSKDAERMLRIAKLRDDMAAEIAKVLMAQRQRSFLIRVVEALSVDDRKQFISWQTSLNPTQKPRWLAIRESVESPVVLMAVINGAVDAEQALVVLETMVAKPTVPKLSPEQWVEKFAKDNPVMGKVIKDTAIAIGLTPDPIPQMSPAQTEAEYRTVITPLIASEKERDERIKSEVRRVQVETSRDERARKDKNFVASLGGKRSSLVPSMKEQEECVAYRRRIRDYFSKPAALETQVQSECTRLAKPYLP